MKELTLRLRTPSGLVVTEQVSSISAEDRTGWFGILPGREDIVAALPPGLLVYRCRETEYFVALAGGLLNLRANDCRVTTPDAIVSIHLDDLADRLESHLSSRRGRHAVQSDALNDLVKEALRRLHSGAAR